MMTTIQTYPLNEQGRDFAVGDIHGCFARLQAFLDDAGFDPAADRLFSVGDLVDRGPESHQALAWLARPWFHAVRGNHEDTAMRYAKGNPVDKGLYSQNGGDWFMAMAPAQQRIFADRFASLPVAIEVETAGGAVGLLHADCPTRSWSRLRDTLTNPPRQSLLSSAEDFCIWSRRRIGDMNESGVEGIRAVVVGHTPLDQPVVLGNVYHIDTGGWLPGGRFTLLDLATLEFAAPR